MKRRKKIEPLALEISKPAERTCVVTARRAKWKETREPTEREIRMLRFIWQRQKLEWRDRFKLHGPTFNSLVGYGLVWGNPRPDKLQARLFLTAEGEDWARKG